MKDKAWKLSPLMFAVAAVFFFMPFMDVSCAGKKVLSFTGIQMVTGTAIAVPQVDQSLKGFLPDGKIDAQPLAVITLSLTILGGAAGFFRKREISIVSAGCAGVGTVTLLLLKSRIDGDVLAKGGGLFQISYSYGFWVILACLTLSIALNAWIFSGQHDEHHSSAGFEPHPEVETDDEW